MKSSYYYSPPNYLTPRTAIEAESAVPALVYFYIIMIVHMGIASVIFQEKYHGIFADAKNLIALIYAGGVHHDSPGTRSYGLAEMQIKLAGELLGIDSNVSDGKAKIYEALLNDETSIELIAKNIARNEKALGIKLKGSAAGFAHNMGVEGYKGSLSPDVEKKISQIIGLLKEVLIINLR